MADAIWQMAVSNEEFEIKVLETENAMYHKENRRLKLEVAELRALLSKRTTKKPKENQ